MVEDFGRAKEASDNDEENVLIQFWEANSNTSEDSKEYWELTTQNKPFYIIYDAGGKDGGLSSYRKQSVCRTITIQDDDDGGGGGGDDDERLQILISRVFRKKRPEEYTCYYGQDTFSNKDFRSWLYIPIYNTSGSPCGVMEYVSTSERYLQKFMKYLGLPLPSFRQSKGMYMYGNHLYGFGRLNILEHAVLEMDQLLTVVCQKFRLPLAQYWVTTHTHTELLRVMYQQSHTEMKNLNFLDKFKQACMEMRLNIDDEGLVGTAYRSHTTFFCNDIKELSITNHHLAQYASFNLSIASFVICLSDMLAGKCVLEFFLPQEMITYNPQTLLNSLWETIKEILPSFKVAAGQKLVQVSSVEVVKLGELKSSLPCHEYEGLPSLEDSHLSNILFGEHELIVVDTSSTTNSYNETATGETLGRALAHNSVAEIIHLDKLEEELSIKCSEPQSLTSKSKRSKKDLINVGNTKEIDHSALETTLEVAIKHKEHTVAADTVDELVEEPPIVDIGHNMSNEDIRYTMNAAPHISNFEPMLSPPQQVEEETMLLLDTSAQNSRNILVTEKDDTTIPVVNKTCPEAHTSKGKIKPQKDISFESLRDHFGRPLDEVAASFGGEWNSPFPGLEYEGHPSPEPSHLWKLLFEEDEHIVDIRSTTNSCNETATVDKLQEESSIKCIEPQSLTSKSKSSKENLINEGFTEEIDHSALETTLEVAIKQKEHIVAAETVDELVEEPCIVDIGNNMEVRYTMNTAPQISNFEPTISFPQQVEEEKMVLDTSAQNSRNILVTEKDETTIPVVNKTCQEAHTSKRKIKPQKDISFESLREHFGRPLDEVAAFFGVSRSTFKRIIRDHDIKRWPNSKRTMSDNISSNLKRKLNDEEPSRRNFSRSSMPSSQDTVIAHTSQHLNKMTIKATYKRFTIRFELSDLSGIAELEDNVIERLHLEKKSFSIEYQDDEDDWILISCDKDVQECMEISRSLKKTTIKMSIDDAPIINHHAT